MRRFLAVLALTAFAGLGQAQSTQQMVGTYKAIFVVPKGAKPTAEQLHQMKLLEKYTKLVLRRNAKWLITDGATAHEGTWTLSRGCVTLAGKTRRAGDLAPVVVYYVSKDRKTLTPKLARPEEAYLKFVKKSSSDNF